MNEHPPCRQANSLKKCTHRNRFSQCTHFTFGFSTLCHGLVQPVVDPVTTMWCVPFFLVCFLEIAFPPQLVGPALHFTMIWQKSKVMILIGIQSVSACISGHMWNSLLGKMSYGASVFTWQWLRVRIYRMRLSPRLLSSFPALVTRGKVGFDF